ncbi:MAG TPA: sulfur carrier protein ThiS [Candidatus Acidoferrum sp.]|nr:sulfur carrier protein ThiS [Candidatus Acidoferrum sp.]
MKVTINGELREIPDGLTVRRLLEHLEMRVERVAVERNLEILPRAKWNMTAVEANDRYEIVQLVGGG